MAHPTQLLLSVPGSSQLVACSNASISLVDSAASAEQRVLASATAETYVIAACIASAQGSKYLATVDDAKKLSIYSLPQLERKSSRELIKRANCLVAGREDEVLVGDKFGDVYGYPVLVDESVAASTSAKKDENGPKAALGHVSMITALAFIPQAPAAAGEQLSGRALVLTGDRDEHVRVSRWPQASIIERYLLGSQSFISAVCYLEEHSLVLSGGGDSTLQVFALDDRCAKTLVQRVSVQALTSRCVVRPGKPSGSYAPAQKGSKGKGKQDAKTEDAEAVAEAVEGEAEKPRAAEAPAAAEPYDQPAIERIVPVHSADGTLRGVLLSSSGSTAVLFVPEQALLAKQEATAPAALELGAPVLDICATSPGGPVLVALDTGKGTSTSGVAGVDVLESGELALCSMANDKLVSAIDGARAQGESAQEARLYSTLYSCASFVGSDDFDLSAPADEGGKQQNGGGKNKRKRGRGQEGAEPAVDAEGRQIPCRPNGKRAKGRNEAHERLRQAQEKAGPAA